MIVSASESSSMEITGDHFKKALAILEETEADMPNAFYGVSSSHHSEQFTDLVRYLETHPSCTFKQLLLEFQLKMPIEDLERHLASLKQSGRVTVHRSATEKVYQITKEDKAPQRSSILKRTLYKRVGNR